MRTFDLKPGRPRRSSPPSPGERLSLHLELHGRRITYRSGDRVGQRFLRAVCGKGRAEDAEDAEGLRACEASASSSSSPLVIPVKAGRGRTLRLLQMAAAEKLGDLHRVERRALAEVVRHAPQGKAVLHRRVLADPADEGGVIAHALDRKSTRLNSSH